MGSKGRKTLRTRRTAQNKEMGTARIWNVFGFKLFASVEFRILKKFGKHNSENSKEDLKIQLELMFDIKEIKFNEII